MKKMVLASVWAFLMLGLMAGSSTACVNLDINVGTIDSDEGRLYAEIVSTFIHERTGTKSIIKYYPDLAALHGAITGKEVELIVIDIEKKLASEGQSLGSADENMQAARKFYTDGMQLVLLAPFGVSSKEKPGSGLTAPVLAKVVLEKFPALPRLLKKLSGKIDSVTGAKLLASVKEKGEKPARVAKDFLVAKRLI